LDDKFKCGILSGKNIRNLFLYVKWWFGLLVYVYNCLFWN